MARRMYDLDNGTEDIKVKKILLEDNTISIKNDGDGNLEIINQSESIILTNAYGFMFYLSDAGLELLHKDEQLCSITIQESFFEVPFRFSPYTTVLRPTNISEGAVIYDSTLKKCILYNGTAWVNLDGTSLGE